MVEHIRQQRIDTDPKGRLQKIVLRRVGMLPVYRVLEQSGRQNDCVFEVGVFVHDKLLGEGKASSIKEAGRIAAQRALVSLQKKDIF